jgi:hypothetical protein
VKTVLACVLGGIALGVLSPLFDGLVNPAVVWAAAAFTAGALLREGRGRIRIAGAAVLTAAAAAYLGALAAFEHGEAGAGTLAVWSVAALLGGAVFATAGSWWHDEERRGRRVVGVCALGGAFLVEAAYQLVNGRPAAGIAIIAAIGLASALTLARGARERLMAVVALVPTTALGFEACFALASVLGAGFTR